MQQRAVSMIFEDEYLESEEISDIKHEYYQGEIFAMAGASRKHNLIVSNVITSLNIQLKKRACRVYPSDMRLKIETTGLYTYPDVMIVCGEERFSNEKENTLLNPDVIIEVLSDSTESYDRGKKFCNYRKLDSLKEYVLISDKCRKIEIYSRNKDNKWELTESSGNNPVISLESIGCMLDISDVYDKTENQVLSFGF